MPDTDPNPQPHLEGTELERFNDMLDAARSHLWQLEEHDRLSATLNEMLLMELSNHREDIPGCALAALAIAACYTGTKTHFPDSPFLNFRPRFDEALTDLQAVFATPDGQDSLKKALQKTSFVREFLEQLQEKLQEERGGSE